MQFQPFFSNPKLSNYIADKAYKLALQFGGSVSAISVLGMSTNTMKRFILLAAVSFFTFAQPVYSDQLEEGRLDYRGFIIDMTELPVVIDMHQEIKYVKRQVDIVVDCGMSPDLLESFRARILTMKYGLKKAAKYGANGIEYDAIPREEGNPVFLNGLLQAYLGSLSGGAKNPTILNYFQEARKLYPKQAAILKNPSDFFAITGSLYLYGNVDCAPYNRDNLRNKQPQYYSFLSDIFGVQK